MENSSSKFCDSDVEYGNIGEPIEFLHLSASDKLSTLKVNGNLGGGGKGNVIMYILLVRL